MLKILAVGAVLLLAAGCAESRFIGLNSCAPDGSPVWWQVKNVNGTYDGAKASPANCKNDD